MFLQFQLSKAENVEKMNTSKKLIFICLILFFKENKVVKTFEEVKYGSGIAIVYNTIK